MARASDALSGSWPAVIFSPIDANRLGIELQEAETIRGLVEIRAEGEGKIMPVRASHIPHSLERTILQKMNATEGLLARQLYPGGQGTLDRMIAKGWIEKQMDAKAGARYRITPTGEAALKTKIPDRPRIRRREPNKPSSL
jgi:hypothetical protein